MRQVSVLAIEKAAQAWCSPSCSHKIMDSDLAISFAIILDEIWSKPWLGNATTEELINELKARIGEGGLQYKTVSPNPKE